MSVHASSFEQKVWSICLMLGATLMALSTFFWQGSEYNVNVGVMVALACTLWIPGMIGLFSLVKRRVPRYATLGLLIAIYGCVGGAFFGFEGMYTDIYDITQTVARQGWAEYPLHVNLTLFWPGPLFPLSLLLLAIVFFWTHSVPRWTAMLLGLGALAFPISRIFRIEWVAHGVDLLLLVPSLYLGWLLWRQSAETASQQQGSADRVFTATPL